MKPHDDTYLLKMVGLGAIALSLHSIFRNLSRIDAFLLSSILLSTFGIFGMILWDHFSKKARERKKAIDAISEEPKALLLPASDRVSLGKEFTLGVSIYLPDSLRSKHVHIIGATGSGKTESVILNLLRQDVQRGLGGIILDAKGDHSFLKHLNAWIPCERLHAFDLGEPQSIPYDPLCSGSAIEAAQRLFSSLNWSEEYYKSKAFSALQKLFQTHFRAKDRNPTLTELDGYLSSPKAYSAFVQSNEYPAKLAEQDFDSLSGLRDQIKILCLGHLGKILSPKDSFGINPSQAQQGKVLYFRLQSLLSPQLVGIVGRLLINHLNFLAGTAHRNPRELANEVRLVPIYLDEFASFACPEFADLISKARSAGFALHFSHQSVGDLMDVSKGFLSQIIDNSATKIVMRINDPDTAEYFARSFGTKIYQKTTQRITNAKEIDRAEVLEEGTQREAHQFRAAPDVFKNLPTGSGAVLIAHGQETPHGASSVFKIKFPKLESIREVHA